MKTQIPGRNHSYIISNPEFDNLQSIFSKLEAISDLYNNLNPGLDRLPKNFGILLEDVLLELGVVISDIEIIQSRAAKNIDSTFAE